MIDIHRYRDGVVEYSLKHLSATGSDLSENSGKKMSKKSCLHGKTESLEKSTKTNKHHGACANGGHHLLANDSENILVFGDRTTVSYMATTNLILADGTFNCVLRGYTQLYIFHVVVANNVSVPALFSLVRGKPKKHTRLSSNLLKGLQREVGKHSSTAQ